MTQQPVRDFDFHGEALDNIFETYRDLRSECPVGWSDRYGGFWFFTKHEDIFNAEQDWQTYSVTPSMLLPDLGNVEPMIPIDVDPPEHTHYRRILLPLFTPSAVDELTPFVVQTARELADEALKQDVVDVSHTYARPLPMIVFSSLIGYPPEDWHLFDQWIDRIFARAEDAEDATRASQEVHAYLEALVERRRNEPEIDDITGRLLKAEINGRPITHDELMSYQYLLFIAGLETTAWTIRAGLWHLARNTADQQRLRENPDLIPAAVEEFLRTLAPVQGMARTALKDVEVRGCPIKKGDRVVLAFGSGNRDEDAYEDSDQIVIDREQNRHFAFGVGVHRCLGSNLGRREVVVALREFLARTPLFEAVDPTEQWHGVGPLHIRFVREA
ncbi:cytochrome P450 [Longivirga aurantiaca]|uniref:Cytochrome P450 n=1 Tax=Longivirga aurantiaca TaxID=1837743 RepID=A0ABW1SY69_9ACTN